MVSPFLHSIPTDRMSQTATDSPPTRDAPASSMASQERSLVSPSAKARRPRGKVVVREDECKGCGLCVQACPFDLLVISQDINREGYHPAAFLDEDGKCTACGLCFRTCPDCALEVYRFRKEVG